MLRETTDKTAVYRREGDYRFGLYITDAGLRSLNISDDGRGTEPAPAVRPEPARTSKSELVKSLLAQSEGASLAQLIGGGAAVRLKAID